MEIIRNIARGRLRITVTIGAIAIGILALIEAYKIWLATESRSRAGGRPLNRVSIKNALINLHCFFDRMTEWDYPNRPQRPLVFAGDLPIIDKPLPRCLDDAAAAKLLRTARQDADPLARLVTELLDRTGIRRSELLGLTVGAVVQIRSAYWPRIPVGKLHNDRYIPLHPQLKELLNDWVTNHRPSDVRCDRLLIERNRPVTAHRVAKILRQQAGEAGIGHVTAHQLRHTLMCRYMRSVGSFYRGEGMGLSVGWQSRSIAARSPRQPAPASPRQPVAGIARPGLQPTHTESQPVLDHGSRERT